MTKRVDCDEVLQKKLENMSVYKDIRKIVKKCYEKYNREGCELDILNFGYYSSFDDWLDRWEIDVACFIECWRDYPCEEIQKLRREIEENVKYYLSKRFIWDVIIVKVNVFNLHRI